MARLMFQVEERKTLKLTRGEAELLVKCLGTLLEEPHRASPFLQVTLHGERAFELRITVDKD
jgi:hypothetical protein